VGQEARGGWVHPKGEDSMVMSVEVVEDKWREPTQALPDYAQNSM